VNRNHSSAALSWRIRLPVVYFCLFTSPPPQISYAPLGLRDHRDMRALLAELHAREVILLPSRIEAQTIQSLQQLYSATSQSSTAVRIFDLTSSAVNFSVNHRKRKAVLTEELFAKLPFSPVSANAQIAFVRCRLGAGDSGDRDLEEIEDAAQPLLKRRMVKDAQPLVSLTPTETTGAPRVDKRTPAPDQATLAHLRAREQASRAIGAEGTLLVCPPKLSVLKQVLADDLHGSAASKLEFRNQYGKRVLHITSHDSANEGEQGLAKLSYIFGSERDDFDFENAIEDEQEMAGAGAAVDEMDDPSGTRKRAHQDIMKLEGTASEQFYRARTALYKRCVCI